MEHLVTHDSAGSTVYERFGDLDDAVGHIEKLRNVDGVTDIALYRLEPVPFEVRPWYRVEIAGSDAADHRVGPVGAGPVGAGRSVPPPPPPPPPGADLFAPVSTEPPGGDPTGADPSDVPPVEVGARFGQHPEPGATAGGPGSNGSARRGLFGR